MKKLGLWVVVAVAAALFTIGAVACSSSKKSNNNTTPQATTEATPTTAVTPGGSTTPNGTPQASGTSTGPVTITLNAMGGSGVTGTAVLSDGAAAGSTNVVVTVDGGLTAGTHQNHIHGPGTCESPADVQDALTPLEAGADGKATGTTPAVPAALSTFEGGHNYVAVHAADGTVVACGNIPAA